MSIKRTISLFATITFLAGLAPTAALAGTAATDIYVLSATQSFDPTIGQAATINYRVDGPASATGLAIDIYRASASTTGVCNPLSVNFVRHIVGPDATRAEGTYNATWTGRK